MIGGKASTGISGISSAGFGSGTTGGIWSVVSAQTLTEAATSIDFTDLSGADAYQIILWVKQSNGGNNVNITLNDDATANNYEGARAAADEGSSMGVSNVQIPWLAINSHATPNSSNGGIVFILPKGHQKMILIQANILNDANNEDNLAWGISRWKSEADVTSIKLTSDVSNKLTIGTQIILLKGVFA